MISNSLGKLPSAIPDTQTYSKSEKEVYESVLQKYYQILQSFLLKMNEFYIKNDEMENTLTSLNEKLQKIQHNTENLHYQFRTTHILIDKRLNEIIADNMNLSDQVKFIRKDIPIESYLSNKNFKTKSAYLKSRKARHENASKNNSDLKSLISSKRIQELDLYNYDKQDVKIKIKTTSKLQPPEQKRKNFPLATRTCKIFPTFQTNEQKQSNQSQQNENESELISYEEQEEQVQIQDELIAKISNRISQLENNTLDKTNLDSFQNKINEQMNQFTSKLNSVIAQCKDDGIKMKAQINQQQNYKLLISQLQQRLGQKIESIKSRMIIEDQIFQQTINQKIAEFQLGLSKMVSVQFFEQSMNNLSAAINIELSTNDKKYSNKHETQRAIRVLEKKINRLMDQDPINNSFNKNKGGNEAYLKITKCQSIKKLESAASEKSIKSRTENINSSSAYGYLQSRNVDQNKIKNSKSQDQHININSLLNKFDWKSKNSSIDLKNQSKVIRSGSYKSSNKYQPSHSTAEQSKNTEKGWKFEKEWKGKVVKILNLANRKHLKVTFR